MAITINCDIGEGYGLYTFGNDERIMPFISIANVACGVHASDPTVMHATVRLALEHGVAVGAHPSLPDRQGFGRREMQMERAELRDLLIYQVGALGGFLRAAGAALSHIKPHGALFGMTSKYEHCAEAAADVAEIFGVPLIGQVGTMHDTVYTRRGLPWWPEFYADLEYDRDCNLIITRRHEPYEPAATATRTLRAIEEGMVTSVEGVDVPIRVETVCIHSDTPGIDAVAPVLREGAGAPHGVTARSSAEQEAGRTQRRMPMPAASRPMGVFLLGDVAPADVVGLSRQVERCGFSDLWFAEDYFMLSGFASAAMGLQATEAIDVGIGAVSNRVRHPAVTAMEASTLANAYPGRFTLGIGHGVPFWVGADAPHAEVGAGLAARGDRRREAPARGRDPHAGGRLLRL